MKGESTVIYIMRHIDIGGNIEIPYKKIGITGGGCATLDSRLREISNTKSPIKAQYVAAWEHENAKKIENALHTIMEDSRVEGEWFLDKENRFLNKIEPIMELIGAKNIEIEKSLDTYSQTILKKESEQKQEYDNILLGKISKLLDQQLQYNSKSNGPTFFSSNKDLTYVIESRKSGEHQFTVARCRDFYNKMKEFLEFKGYDVSETRNGNAKIFCVTNEEIAKLINEIESEFKL